MAHAKKMSQATLQFLITDTGGLDLEDLSLSIIAALAADGHAQALRDGFNFALDQKVMAVNIREAVFHITPFAGHYRAQQALKILKKVGAERAKPTDAFSAIMGGGPSAELDKATQADVGKPSADEESKRVERASQQFDKIHKSSLSESKKQRDEPSLTLGHWLNQDIYGRQFARPKLAFQTRLLLSVAALFSLEMKAPLSQWLRASKDNGLSVAQLWHIHGLLKRLFRDGHHQVVAEDAFKEVLGAKKGDGLVDGKDPFRWD